MGNYFSQSQQAQEQPPVHLGDLQSYITKELASTTFQTKGSYAFDPHTHGGLYLTKDQISKAYQTAGSYALASSLAAYAPLVHQHSEYLLTSHFNRSAGSYALTSQLADYQTAGNYALASQLANYQAKGDYALESQLSNYQAKGDYALASQLANYQAKGDYAAASHNHDSVYQAKGNYVTTDASGNAQISGNQVLEFGRGVTKEGNAGKIGYGTFDNGASLNIVGAGTAGGRRQVRLWDNLTVDRNLTVSGNVNLSGNNFVRFDHNSDFGEIALKNYGNNRQDLTLTWGDDANDNLRFINRTAAGEKELMRMDRNNIYIAGNTVPLAQQFKVGGVDTRFYPVVFDVSSSWDERGNYKIYIQRSSIHLDSQSKGSLNLQIDGHNDNWGNGAQYLNYQFSQSRLRFIGNIQEDPNSRRIVVTLRGNTTYRWVAEGGVLENANTTGTALTLTTLTANNTYNILDVINTAFDRDSSSSTSINDIRFAGDARVGGNLCIDNLCLTKNELQSLKNQSIQGVNGRYIRLSRADSGSINLSKIQVFRPTGDNIANATTTRITASSILAPAGNTTYGVDKLIDNSLSSIFHTDNAANQWVEIDFGSLNTISKITVWNRADCCQTRSNGLVLTILDASRNVVYTSLPLTDKLGRSTYVNNENVGFSKFDFLPPNVNWIGS
jgi:hypothetical protein